VWILFQKMSNNTFFGVSKVSGARYFIPDLYFVYSCTTTRCSSMHLWAIIIFQRQEWTLIPLRAEYGRNIVGSVVFNLWRFVWLPTVGDRAGTARDARGRLNAFTGSVLWIVGLHLSSPSCSGQTLALRVISNNKRSSFVKDDNELLTVTLDGA
jgi:hypothetical protein